MSNRQLRSWVFMLYPDNPKHLKALDYLDIVDNALFIKHIEKKNDDGSIINKEHYHCVMKFDNGYWLSSLLKDLGLSKEDEHLFHSYTDFKSGKKQRYKSLDDYVDYLDHQMDDSKPDKYDPDDFHGGLKSWALNIISRRGEDRYFRLLDLDQFIRKYNLEHFNECRTFSFNDWFKLCCDNGYGDLFYKEWYKMRDLLKAYITY